MLTPDKLSYIDMSALEQPYLVVVIDTEEDFDWSQDFDRKNTNVHSVEFIKRGQQVFDDFNIKPVYVVDYAIVSQLDGYKLLRNIYQNGRCEIGVHLHPWVTPPFKEKVNRNNSFAGNLPLKLEKEKIILTCEVIEHVFGKRPKIYKAGRYGVGPNTTKILEDLDFEIDLSVCPGMNFSSEGGPDFTDYGPMPFWFGQHLQMLELPLTNGFTGVFSKYSKKLYKLISAPLASQVHAPGIAARLGLLNKICLSPEGFTISELTKLTQVLYADGLRIFSFSFHSPSLDIGKTPYVKTNKDLEEFLHRLETFFNFFLNELGGQSVTPIELKNQILQHPKLRNKENS